MRRLLASRLPLKLKIFLWLAIQGRLQTGVALKHKKWKGEADCHICGVPETVDHVLFQCVIAHFVWTCFKEILGWDSIPIGLDDLFENWVYFV